jgi:hypothetical protein
MEIFFMIVPLPWGAQGRALHGLHARVVQARRAAIAAIPTNLQEIILKDELTI